MERKKGKGGVNLAKTVPHESIFGRSQTAYYYQSNVRLQRAGKKERRGGGQIQVESWVSNFSTFVAGGREERERKGKDAGTSGGASRFLSILSGKLKEEKKRPTD